jgi:ATP-dependent RNA helicase RhlE
MGFIEPTPIQLRAFPIVLAGEDLIGTAQTGTGKTAAFALPILTLLAKHGALRCLVIEPTRELAAQVETAFRDYGRFTDLRVSLVHGGVGYGKQRQDLKRGVDILVATPGRLLDLLEQRATSLESVNILVLDEVDRMLDMGFLPDVRRIVEKISTDRQTLLFSATLPPEIERLAAWVLRDPELVEIGIRRSPAETITHAVYPVAAEQKFDLLIALLERTNFDSVLIFCRTKVNADRVAHFLKHAQHAVAVLHSNRTQRERIEALDGFKSGKYEVMVATDIASRGLDIAGVSHVINYDVPEHPEDYVHRIGRTGRAQNVGDAFTLMSGEELPAVQAIEHFISQKIPRLKLENFPYLFTALFEPDTSLGRKHHIGGTRARRGYSFSRPRR